MPTGDTAFDAALLRPTYRSEGDRWQLYVDQDLQAIFGTDDALGAADLVPRWAALMREKFPKAIWASIPVGSIVSQHCEGAGNLIHWGVAFDLVTQEAGPDGQSRWRLVRTEPTFAVDPNRAWGTIRIRGLPPEQQAAQYRRETRLRKLHATLDRKARNKADAEIQRRVAAMVELDPDGLFDAPILQARLPEICNGRRLDEIVTILVDTHHRLGMTRDELRIWIRDLGREFHARQWTNRQGIFRWRRDDDEFRWRLDDDKPPVPAEIPAEDEEALAALAF